MSEYESLLATASATRQVAVATAKACAVTGAGGGIPQLIDADVELVAFELLSSLTLGVNAHVGLKAARHILREHRPALVIMCRDDGVPRKAAAKLRDLRSHATARGVPLVHALTLDDVKLAMRPRMFHDDRWERGVVTIMGFPDDRASALAVLLMLLGAEAYGAYVRAYAARRLQELVAEAREPSAREPSAPPTPTSAGPEPAAVMTLGAPGAVPKERRGAIEAAAARVSLASALLTSPAASGAWPAVFVS